MKLIAVKLLTLLLGLILTSISYGQSNEEITIEKVNIDTEKIRAGQNEKIKSVEAPNTSHPTSEEPKEIVRTLQNKQNQAQSYSITTGNTYSLDRTANEPLSKEEQIEKLEKSIQSGESKVAFLSDDYEANQLEIEQKLLKVQQWKDELELLKK